VEGAEVVNGVINRPAEGAIKWLPTGMSSGWPDLISLREFISLPATFKRVFAVR
jgi:hypothetical protein